MLFPCIFFYNALSRFFKKTITWLYLKNEHQNRKKIVGKLIGKKEEIISKVNKESQYTDLVIPQSNGSEIKFCWNGTEYQLVVDLSYWTQPYSIESFIDKIAQQYAGEVIVGESKRFGFQPIHYKENHDGSNTLILERWKNS